MATPYFDRSERVPNFQHPLTCENAVAGTISVSKPNQDSQNPGLLGTTASQFIFSVIVPCLNEEELIGRCLDLLVNQDFPRDALEVIVVDNGSTDRTLEIAGSFALHLNLTILSKPNANISALRNLGAERSRGNLLAFLDADCLAPPNWLRDATLSFQEDVVRVIGASYRIPDDASWVSRTWYQEWKPAQPRNVSYVPSGDLMVSRASFFLVGGFDESLETAEDYDFCHRARASGLAIFDLPAVRVVHLGTPQTLRAFFRKQRWHGRHAWKLFFRDLSAFHSVKAHLLAFYILFCLAGTVGGLLVGMASGRWKILTAFLLALALGPLGLGVLTAVVRRRWAQVLPLATLFLAYGLARAVSLMDFVRYLVVGRRNQVRS
jgi:glycosyltransferase involved in cell wall biosynthesis